jgi:hypothetical protein
MPTTENPKLNHEYVLLTKYPDLLQSFRAHTRSINRICFADKHELIITSSLDLNIRIFSLTGQYIGVFGQKKAWNDSLSTSVRHK